jgi:hypothetical protein
MFWQIHSMEIEQFKKTVFLIIIRNNGYLVKNQNIYLMQINLYIQKINPKILLTYFIV